MLAIDITKYIKNFHVLIQFITQVLICDTFVTDQYEISSCFFCDVFFNTLVLNFVKCFNYQCKSYLSVIFIYIYIGIINYLVLFNLIVQRITVSGNTSFILIRGLCLY